MGGLRCWPLQSSGIHVTINLRRLLPADAQTAISRRLSQPNSGRSESNPTP